MISIAHVSSELRIRLCVLLTIVVLAQLRVQRAAAARGLVST
jgi:hypothetical protein